MGGLLLERSWETTPIRVGASPAPTLHERNAYPYRVGAGLAPTLAATTVEDDLVRRWYALSPDVSLPLINGEKCKLVYVGRPGGPQGPDVHDAVLQFAVEQGGQVVGDVEFHVRCSDWYRHGHHADVRYNNVVLHVVL